MPPFYERHKGKIWFLGFTVFAVGSFFLIWATAGTSLPIVAAIGAKIGLNLGFLSTWSVPFASAAAATLVTGATFLTAVVASIATSVLSKLYSCIKCSHCSNTGEDDLATLTSDRGSHAKMQRAGMTPNGKEVMMRERETRAKPNDDENHAKTPDSASQVILEEEHEDTQRRSPVHG